MILKLFLYIVELYLFFYVIRLSWRNYKKAHKPIDKLRTGFILTTMIVSVILICYLNIYIFKILLL